MIESVTLGMLLLLAAIAIAILRTGHLVLTDTPGAWQVLAGMMVVIGPSLPAFKRGLTGLFLFFTAPTSSYAIANAAWLDTRVPKPPAMEDPPFRKGNATE